MKAFIHIGIPKTGTTTLQQFLHTNRDQLITEGILFPKVFGLNSMSMVVASYHHKRRDGLTKILKIESDKDIDGLRESLVRNIKHELQNTEDIISVIFSSEYFQLSLQTDSELKSLQSLLHEIGFKEIYIVAYLREQADLANSFYSTAVRAGETAGQPPSPCDPRYNHLCDHKGTLDRYARTFGKSNILINIFEKEHLKNDSIIDDFMSIIDSNSSLESLTVPKNKNEGLSTEGTLILCQLNKYFPRWINHSLNPLRQHAIEFTEEHYSNGKYTMPVEIYNEYRKHFEDDNEWIRKSYFPSKSSLFQQIKQPIDAAEIRSGGISSSDIQKYVHIIIDSNNFSITECDLTNTALGVCYYHLDLHEKARYHFNLALDKNPKNKDALKYIAQCLMNGKLYREAVNYFDRLIQIDQSDSISWLNKARCQIHTKNYVCAEKTLLESLEKFPNHYPLSAEYANLPVKSDNTDLAVSRWVNVCLQNPANPAAFYTTARLLTNVERDEEALSYFDTLLTLKPMHENGIYDKASCLIKLEHFDAAKKTLLYGLEIQPNSTRYHSALADLAMTRNKIDEAINRWLELVNKFPENMQFTFRLAACYMRNRKYKSASSYFSKLLASSPSNKIYIEYNDRCDRLKNREYLHSSNRNA